MAESIGPMWPKQQPNPGAGTEPPPAGRPRAQAKERVGRNTPSFIVRDEFRPANPRSGCSPALPVSASPARPDYHAPSPRPDKTGHFYFAGNRTFLLCVDSHGLSGCFDHLKAELSTLPRQPVFVCGG